MRPGVPKPKRPLGTNVAEWHLFLAEHMDARAALPYVAVQIAEAIAEAERKAAHRALSEIL